VKREEEGGETWGEVGRFTCARREAHDKVSFKQVLRKVANTRARRSVNKKKRGRQLSVLAEVRHKAEAYVPQQTSRQNLEINEGIQQKEKKKES